MTSKTLVVVLALAVAATLNAVLTYIDGQLNEGQAGSALEVLVQNSQDDGTSFLASAGTYYYLTGTFNPGFAHSHITTGVDPNAGMADIQVTVDFGYTWNSDTGPVAAGEYDLYSVLLHEMTHGLGIAGTTDAAGNSTLGNSTYSTYAGLLYRISGGTKAFDTIPGPSITYQLAAGDLDAGDDTIELRSSSGAYALSGTFPRVYTPTTFATGSSVSHWQTAGATMPDDSLMQYSIGSNIERRSWLTFERSVLKDLGYSEILGAVPVELSGFSTE